MVIAWVKLGKPDISMMLNGALGALVAITAASGFVAPWAAIVIGAGSGAIAVFGVIFVERIGIDDPIGAVAVHGMSGVWGTLACGLFAVPVLASNLATGHKGLFYGGGFHQLGVQALGLVTVGAFTFGTSFGCLWVLNKIWGIRVDAGGGDSGPRRARARHVGLSGVLHPGPRRLRHGEPRAPRHRAQARAHARARDAGGPGLLAGDIAVTCTCLKPVPVERATRKGAARTECACCGKQIRLTLGKGRRFGAAPFPP